MATVDELFNQMDEEGAYQDAHDIILIDPVTRTLNIPTSEIILGVEGDVRGERKYFGCPCIVGNDVCLTDSDIHINYTNANGDTGCFKVSGINERNNLVMFSWEITDKVVLLRGDVQFVICVRHRAGAEREWHTTTATGKVLPGIDRGNAEIEEDSIKGGWAGSAVLGIAILGIARLGFDGRERLSAPVVYLTTEDHGKLDAPTIYLYAAEAGQLNTPIIYIDVQKLSAPVITLEEV